MIAWAETAETLQLRPEPARRPARSVTHRRSVRNRAHGDTGAAMRHALEAGCSRTIYREHLTRGAAFPHCVGRHTFGRSPGTRTGT